jgi:hypothetical protein
MQDENDQRNKCAFSIRYGEFNTIWIGESTIETKNWIKSIKEYQTQAKNSKDIHTEIKGVTSMQDLK